jgi:hypothetical protein
VQAIGDLDNVNVTTVPFQLSKPAPGGRDERHRAAVMPVTAPGGVVWRIVAFASRTLVRVL